MIQITSVTLLPDGAWQFTWNSSGASFYRIVLWGVVVGITVEPAYTWDGQEYQTFPPPLEIAYEDQEVTSEQFLPYLVVQWYGETADSYQIQKWDGSAWQVVTTYEETGEWVYTYYTPTLADETSYSYRVIALDSFGNQSVPRVYDRYVVTPPAPVDGHVRAGYSNGNVVVSAQ